MLRKLLVLKLCNRFCFAKFYQFSKLDHFFEKFEMDKFDSDTQFTPTNGNFKFSKILESLEKGKQSLFNSSLNDYLTTQTINFEQLLALLVALHQTNIFCNKSNKEILLKYINSNLNTINIGVLQMISHSLSLGIADQQTLSLYFQHFLKCNLKRFNHIQQFDMIFIISQAVLKYQVNLDNSEFANQWKLLLQLLLPHLETKKDWLVKKFPHLAFIIKSAGKDDAQSFFIEDLINLFKAMTSKFNQQAELIYKLDSKEITILLSSVIKIRDRYLTQELNILIDNLIKYLIRYDFSKFNDSSLQSLALSITHFPSYQSQFYELLVDQIEQRKQKGKFNTKQHISIIFELSIKWKNKGSNVKLVNVIQSLSVIEQSDYDLAHYFQILTTLPLEYIIDLLKSIEFDLIQRNEKIAQDQNYKKDSISVERMQKSLLKIEGQVKQQILSSVNLQLIQKIQNLLK
ncbi:unnamed protein product (macronuclear) [Paramecium tetraurelia]|uniref:Uncharacterized protein n=1 Tax=Paramecium tetraurelia TaxID=5888 RepID=A0BZ96_PARTE|nr:uncharacterized protein GSPATT00033716001 [Paramecium tetraurelia]CAK63863.1 unnamed protein product [Paramecium tetraurelia]|eukprot:XP_001431261.1 hypothetical protein (macronuclear) [Paramecium tetraurelia strain d4-2]